MATFKQHYIGIDLGTSTTGIAVVKENSGGTPEMLGDGLKLFPSEVFVPSDEKKPFLVNKKKQPADTNRAYDAKRFIGRKINDKNVEEVCRLSNNQYKVISSENKQAFMRFEWRRKKKIRDILPQTISAEVLKYAIFLYFDKCHPQIVGEKPQVEAVITVPANFTEAQRSATREAAEIANIKVIRLIAEPTAAAIAYLHHNNKRNDGLYLVFDFGGGTLDVSLLEKRGENFTAKGTAGDTLLGGRDIDNLIFEELSERLKEHSISFAPNARMSAKEVRMAIKRGNLLRQYCKEGKETLSDALEFQVALDEFVDDSDDDGVETLHSITFTRDQLDSLLNRNIIHRIMEPIKSVLKSTQTSTSDLEAVILAGGSSRIPLVRQKLAQFFQGCGDDLLRNDMNPDQLVAEGAAITSSRARDGTIVDCVPDDFGIMTKGDKMSVLLKKNLPLPATKTGDYTTTTDNQTEVCLELLQGPHPVASDNQLLYQSFLRGIIPRPKGETEVLVTMMLDESGLLVLTATCDGQREEIKVDLKGRLTNANIQQLQKGGKDVPLVSKEMRELAEKALQAECTYRELSYGQKRALQDIPSKLEVLQTFVDRAQSDAETSSSEIRKWLDTADELLTRIKKVSST